MTEKKKNTAHTKFLKRLLMASVVYSVLITVMLVITIEQQPRVITPTLSSEVDQFSVQATLLLLQLTVSAEADATATAEAIASFEPISTMSADAQTELREDWLTIIETEVGFSHHVLTQLVEDRIQYVLQEIDHRNESRSHSRIRNDLPPDFEITSERLTYEGDNYIVVRLPYYLQSNSHVVLLFRQTDEDIVLMFDSREFDLSCCYSWFGDFADRNGNDYPDISIHASTNDNYPNSGLALIELRPNREWVNLTDGISARMMRFVDFEKDGILELETLQHPQIPSSIWNKINYRDDYWTLRWYQWDGESYVPLPVFGDMDD